MERNTRRETQERSPLTGGTGAFSGPVEGRAVWMLGWVATEEQRLGCWGLRRSAETTSFGGTGVGHGDDTGVHDRLPTSGGRGFRGVPWSHTLTGRFKRRSPDTASRRRRPRARLTQCGFCGTDFMHPLDWGRTGRRLLVMSLRCGGVMRKQTVPDAEAHRLDREVNRAQAAIARETERLCPERLVAEVDAFAAGLELAHLRRTSSRGARPLRPARVPLVMRAAPRVHQRAPLPLLEAAETLPEPIVHGLRGGQVNALTVWKFNSPEGGEQALTKLRELAKQQLVSVDDAAIMSWPEGRNKPKTRNLGQPDRARCAVGRLLGVAVRADATTGSTTTSSRRFAERSRPAPRRSSCLHTARSSIAWRLSSKDPTWS
jgi:hypothetical protein